MTDMELAVAPQFSAHGTAEESASFNLTVNDSHSIDKLWLGSFWWCCFVAMDWCFDSCFVEFCVDGERTDAVGAAAVVGRHVKVLVLCSRFFENVMATS